MTVPTISSPLRILILSSPFATEPSIFQGKDTNEITTRYYQGCIPIWRDALPLQPSSLKDWQREWAAPQAREVVEAVGAWIILVTSPVTRENVTNLRAVLEAVNSTVEMHAPSKGPLMLVLHVQSLEMMVPTLELKAMEWEDVCFESGGYEYVDLRDPGQSTESINEFGEKTGEGRLLEALEANVWEAGGGEDEEAEDGELDIGGDGLVEELEAESRGEAAEQQQEMQIGLLHDQAEGEERQSDKDVVALESMMTRLHTLREAGADLPQQERRRMARKAVEEVMRGL